MAFWRDHCDVNGSLQVGARPGTAHNNSKKTATCLEPDPRVVIDRTGFHPTSRKLYEGKNSRDAIRGFVSVKSHFSGAALTVSQ
jgi:hypothetical protein